MLAPVVLLASALEGASPASIPPPPERFVTDTARVMSAGAREALEAELAGHARATGRQVVVWIGDSLGGAPLEEWAARTFAAWGVGRKGLDDGVVLFVLTGDRRARIEVGYGLEAAVPDVLAGRILDQHLVPALGAGRIDEGVLGAARAIVGATGGGAPLPEEPPSLFEILAAGLALLLLVLLVARHPWLGMLVLSRLARGRGAGFSGGGRSGGGGATRPW